MFSIENKITNANTKVSRGLILVVLLGCGLMILVEEFVPGGYVIKSLFKAVIFLGLPIGYSKTRHALNLKIDLKRPTMRQFINSLAMGLAVYALILGAFVLFSAWIDLDRISHILAQQMKINKDNFIFIAIYIAVVNSFLEEFFFRGFAFLTLKTAVSRQKAYCFSAVLFSIYHVAILDGWFTPSLFVLALVGLVVAGILFNWLDEHNNTIYNSWLVHMCANLAINTIGVMMFAGAL